jgi:predicted dehydrogenase
MSLRVLLIGYGEMGRRSHLPMLLKGPPTVTVVGVVRRNQKPIDEIPNVPVFDNSDTAIERLKPDLSVISTPHAFHATQIRSALKNDSHVFVEKPLALNFNEATELVSLAKERSRLLVVGLQRRYEGFSSIIRELKSDGRLGSILHAHGLFAHTFDSIGPHGWRSDPKLAGAGILDDSAYHILDVMLAATGGEVQRLAGCHVLDSGLGIPQSFSTILEMDCGAMVTVSGSYLSPKQSVQEEISIFGSKGSVFARRFCREWNTDPPVVFFKSRDGSASQDFDLHSRPSGRELPLKAMVAVLIGQLSRGALMTEATDTLATHRAIALIKQHTPANCALG